MCGIAGFISPSGRVTEAVKGLIDVVSITTGLDRMILRHRALHCQCIGYCQVGAVLGAMQQTNIAEPVTACAL